jgi:hypothetical protein
VREKELGAADRQPGDNRFLSEFPRQFRTKRILVEFNSCVSFVTASIGAICVIGGPSSDQELYRPVPSLPLSGMKGVSVLNDFSENWAHVMFKDSGSQR